MAISNARVWRFLRTDLPTISIVIALLSLWISWDTRKQDESRRLKEEQNRAYLAFQLGKELTRGTISFVGLNRNFSERKIFEQQGIVDQLGLRLTLDSLFAGERREYAPGSWVIYLSPFETISKRIRAFHGERIAAAFDIARRVQWLSFLADCANSVTREERLRGQYEGEAGMVYQDMRKLGLLFKRDLSKYTLPEDPTTTKVIADKLMSVLMSMEFVLQERSDPVTGSSLSCPESDF